MHAGFFLGRVQFPATKQLATYQYEYVPKDCIWQASLDTFIVRFMCDDSQGKYRVFESDLASLLAWKAYARTQAHPSVPETHKSCYSCAHPYQLA